MIEVSHLYKTYDRHRLNANTVLHDISFTLPETGFVCILGASGCGKTSLLNAIGGLDRFDKGTLSTANVKVSRYGTAIYEAERNRSFGYIFQNYYLLMEHSVAYNVYLGLHNLKLTHKEKLKRVRQALKAVEMENYLRRTVGELSGGQQQRVAIARALARKPRVIFADEPTGNLDEANTLNICSVLRKISKTSLVVMVTHEERIANFFADRIITLSEGRIASDEENTRQDGLSAAGGKTLYAGDYEETTLAEEGIDLRLLKEEGAAPVGITIVALKDRIVIKLADSRSITCGSPEQPPELLEGNRPVLTLQELDNSHADEDPLLLQQPQQHTRAGKGLKFSMLVREAVQLGSSKSGRRTGLRLFLALLALLTALTVADYLTVSSIDPETFITTHSQMLEIEVGQGPVMNPTTNATTFKVQQFLEYLDGSGVDYTFVPHVALAAEYKVKLFSQMEDVSMNFGKFSYVPLAQLDEATLISGRMPENAEEIVVDRWLLDAAAAQTGIIQNNIRDSSYFLGCQLAYSKRNYSPTIVGICDSGQPAIYMDTAGMISIGVSGAAVLPLSDLQKMFPGEFDHIVLEDTQCLVVANNAGEVFYSRIGGTYSTSVRTSYTIADVIEADVDCSIVVNDSCIDALLADMYNTRFHLFCPDKAAMKTLLEDAASPGELEGYTRITVTDAYSDDMAAFTAATEQKVDARMIVTVTILALSMIMLYLLCRAQAQSRIGMMAVYRLLGIPKRKLGAIFAVETLLLSLRTALPVVIAVWGVLQILARIPALGISLLLPWQAAGAVYLAILGYHLVVSLLPLRRLLRLPPAQLAAKYDL